MKKQCAYILSHYMEDIVFRRLWGAFAGFVSTFVFAIYNGFLGLRELSLWHGSICVYYIFLSALRGILFVSEKKLRATDAEAAAAYRKKIFYLTSVMMLVMNGALTVPVSLMVLDERPIYVGLVPAIATAAYTTYKISAAAVGLKRKEGGIFIRELGVIRFVDALVSLMLLQNSLITAVEGKISSKMFRLSAVSSAVITLTIFTVSLLWLIKSSKSLKSLS